MKDIYYKSNAKSVSLLIQISAVSLLFYLVFLFRTALPSPALPCPTQSSPALPCPALLSFVPFRPAPPCSDPFNYVAFCSVTFCPVPCCSSSITTSPVLLCPALPCPALHFFPLRCWTPLCFRIFVSFYRFELTEIIRKLYSVLICDLPLRYGP